MRSSTAITLCAIYARLTPNDNSWTHWIDYHQLGALFYLSREFLFMMGFSDLKSAYLKLKIRKVWPRRMWGFKTSNIENPGRWLNASQIIEQFKHHAAHQSLLLSLRMHSSGGDAHFFCWEGSNGDSDAPWKGIGRIHCVEKVREEPGTCRLHSPVWCSDSLSDLHH